MKHLRYFPACFCAVSCLMLFAAPLQAELTLADGTATGEWYDPAREGEGFWTEVIHYGDNKMVAISMYSFDSEGNQLWLAGAAPIDADDTVVTIPVILVEGPMWGANYDPDDSVTTDFGTIVVRFPTCDSGLFNVQSNVEGLESHNYSLIRLTNIVGVECTDAPPAPPPEPPPTPEGGVTPGLWTGQGTCFFVNEEGNKILESDLCDNGKALSLESRGFNVDIDGKWDPDSCQANAVCNGTWNISFEDDHASVSCINTLEGMVNIYFSTPTEASVEGWQESGELNWCVGISNAAP